MRTGRYVAFASVLAALVAAAPAEARPAPHIAGAQVALRAEGLYRGPVDGLLGPRTTRALRAFQRREGIAVDGVVGAQTRRHFGRLGRPLFGRRVLRRGMVGWDVSVLQFLLERRGAGVGVDGIYGRATQRAVRSFQRRAALGADGIAGPATARALGRPAAARAKPSAPRERGANRREVRRMLGYWARRYDVSPSLVRAVAWMESGFHWNVTSPAGAWGVMQVMPSTWRFVEDVLTGKDFRRTARGNVRVGTLYLRHLLHRFGSRRLALAAYYQGPAAVRRHGVYRETRVYVRAILGLQRRFLA